MAPQPSNLHFHSLEIRCWIWREDAACVREFGVGELGEGEELMLVAIVIDCE